MPSTASPNTIPLDDESLAPGTERTLAILELLGRHRAGLSLTEIARELDLPVNSVFRITGTLHNRGYLQRREDDKRFVLTNKLFDLSRRPNSDSRAGSTRKVAARQAVTPRATSVPALRNPGTRDEPRLPKPTPVVRVIKIIARPDPSMVPRIPSPGRSLPP